MSQTSSCLLLNVCMMSVVGFIFVAACPAEQTANQAQEEGAAGGRLQRARRGGTDGDQISSIVFIHSKQIMSRDGVTYSEAGSLEEEATRARLLQMRRSELKQTESDGAVVLFSSTNEVKKKKHTHMWVVIGWMESLPPIARLCASWLQREGRITVWSASWHHITLSSSCQSFWHRSCFMDKVCFSSDVVGLLRLNSRRLTLPADSARRAGVYTTTTTTTTTHLQTTGWRYSGPAALLLSSSLIFATQTSSCLLNFTRGELEGTKLMLTAAEFFSLDWKSYLRSLRSRQNVKGQSPQRTFRSLLSCSCWFCRQSFKDRVHAKLKLTKYWHVSFCLKKPNTRPMKNINPVFTYSGTDTPLMCPHTVLYVMSHCSQPVGFIFIKSYIYELVWNIPHISSIYL